ncbi:hypothetical protein RhiirA1_484168 [Rhizophagus irregularis]|uniref:Uncharacterized protein n=1 Tax=Rhizophagus irregularis TaxID=588596 RepID=A0A2N0QJM2_9GLOM|nr:hypothetical protein RhiirA1_484168 [Rhizophagus irregularis]
MEDEKKLWKMKRSDGRQKEVMGTKMSDGRRKEVMEEEWWEIDGRRKEAMRDKKRQKEMIGSKQERKRNNGK